LPKKPTFSRSRSASIGKKEFDFIEGIGGKVTMNKNAREADAKLDLCKRIAKRKSKRIRYSSIGQGRLL
jgi:hypothetical protein